MTYDYDFAVAVFAHFSGVPRLPDSRPDDIRLISRDDAGSAGYP